MKKMRNLLLLFAVATLLFGACAKEDTAEGIVIGDTIKSTATINGIACLNVYTSEGLVQQFVPAGTQLLFTVENSEYGINSADGKYVKEATVGANGAFTVTMPARTDGVAVAVSINGSPIVIDVNVDDRLEKQLFTLTEVNEYVIKNFTYTKKLVYELRENLN
jgi:hypothetical protein